MASLNRGIHKKHRSRLVADRTDWQTPFVQSLAKKAIILDACLDACIERQTYYNWARRTDAKAKKFQARVQDAIEQARDVLRREIYRRAVEGIERKRFTSRGEVINDPDTGKQYVEREYSDPLLLKLATAHLPEFKEKVEHVTPDGKPLEHKHTIAFDYDQFAQRFGEFAGRAGGGTAPPNGN